MKITGEQRSFSISPESSSAGSTYDDLRGTAGMATEGTHKSMALDLGVQEWKVSPSHMIEPDATLTLAEIEGPGQIDSIWLTCDYNKARNLLLRMDWDDQRCVEVPVADFFCDGWLRRPDMNSKTIQLLPPQGYNCNWRMPFRGSANITLENVGNQSDEVYYQVSGHWGEVAEDEAYFNATWRRANPVGDSGIFTILDGVEGTGAYVGTYIAMQPNQEGWPGEGEIKVYYDEDEFPTICYTGLEDYFGGAWNWDKGKGYIPHSTAYKGVPYVGPEGSTYQKNQKFGAYRWHLPDPIYFNDEKLRIAVQSLGMEMVEKPDRRYLLLSEADIAATAIWYQLPHRSPQPSLAEQAGKLGVSLASHLEVEPEWKEQLDMQQLDSANHLSGGSTD